MAGCAHWLNSNDFFTSIDVEQLRNVAQSTVQGNGDLNQVTQAASQQLEEQELQPLNWPIVGKIVSSFVAGLGGLLLVISTFFGGWKTSVIAIPIGLALALLGSMGFLP